MSLPLVQAVQSISVVGLPTYVYTVPTGQDGQYRVDVVSQIQPASSLSIVITQAGSASSSITSTAPAAAQTHVEVSKQFNCAAADTLTVALSSSAAIDEQFNNVNSLIQVVRVA